MNSRERVIAAVNGWTIDRVPARFNGRPDQLAKSIAAELNIPLDGDWFEDLQRHLCIDVRIVDAEVISGDYSGDSLNLARAETARDVDLLWPAKWNAENRTLKAARQRVAEWDASGSCPAVQLRLPSLFGMVRRMRGDTQALMDLADANEVFLRIMDRMEKYNAEMIDKGFETFGNRLDLVSLVEELGMQRGLMYSPEQIQRHFLGRLERLCQCVHDRGGKVFYHSCGAIEPLIDQIIGIGVDVLNPIQPRLKGMDPEHLAAHFGSRITFCGGMDMQHLMPHGTPREIAAEVRRYVHCLAPRYILDLANILHPDIPPRNTIALYSAPRQLF